MNKKMFLIILLSSTSIGLQGSGEQKTLQQASTTAVATPARSFNLTPRQQQIVDKLGEDLKNDPGFDRGEGNGFVLAIMHLAATKYCGYREILEDTDVNSRQKTVERGFRHDIMWHIANGAANAEVVPHADNIPGLSQKVDQRFNYRPLCQYIMNNQTSMTGAKIIEPQPMFQAIMTNIHSQ